MYTWGGQDIIMHVWKIMNIAGRFCFFNWSALGSLYTKNETMALLHVATLIVERKYYGNP